MSIHPFHPNHTPLPLRPGRLLRVPIQHKLGGTEAVCGFRLPTVVIGNRAKQLNLMIGATGQQVAGVVVPSVIRLGVSSSQVSVRWTL
jgi:hypothetical protein